MYLLECSGSAEGAQAVRASSEIRGHGSPSVSWAVPAGGSSCCHLLAQAVPRCLLSESQPIIPSPSVFRHCAPVPLPVGTSTGGPVAISPSSLKSQGVLAGVTGGE